MGFYTRRQLIHWGILFFVIVYIRSTEQATIPTPSEEQGNSSSGEIDLISSEDSNESDEQLQKRSTDSSGNNGMSPHLIIPGLPDPAAILKVIEVLQSVGQQVIPVLVEGINAPAERIAELLNRDLKMFRRFKTRLDLFGGIKQR